VKTHFPTAVSGLLSVALVFCANSKSFAGITWAETSKSIIVESGTASTIYGFRNDGPEEMRIAAVKPSCDCVTASASQKTVAPGKTAEISAIFRGKNHLGSEDKTIAVVSISGTEQQVEVLKLHVDIRPDVVLDPPTLTWAKDAPPQAKVVRIKASHPDQAPVSITRLDGGKPGFTVTQEAAEDEPQFSVTPESTAKPQRALIRVTAQKADKSNRDLIIYAIVRP